MDGLRHRWPGILDSFPHGVKDDKVDNVRLSGIKCLLSLPCPKVWPCGSAMSLFDCVE